MNYTFFSLFFSLISFTYKGLYANMNQELTRRYPQPVPVSAATALHYRQYKNSTSVNSSLGSIPDHIELLNIKADLEALLPLSERRIRNLTRDLSNIKKNVRARELTQDEQRQLDQQQVQLQKKQQQQAQQHQLQQQTQPQHDPSKKSGKSTSPAILEKLQIKQENTDETLDMLHSNTHNKNQLERQLALEALRRKRRRDDDISLPKSSTSRSESPLNVVKLKRMDDAASNTATRSLSPPSTVSTPTAKSHSKSGQHTKKKKSTDANRNHGNKQQNNAKAHNRSSTPDTDFVRVKAKDQVPILTFWTAIDPHFRPLAEEDRSFLMPKEDDDKFYTIPPLGRHYTDVWSEDDIPAMSRSHSPMSSSSRQGSYDHVKYLTHPLTDDHLFKGDISCGKLTERLLSSLVADEGIMIHDEEDDQDDILSDDLLNTTKDYHHNRSIEEMSSIPPDDIALFEERLKTELRYAGLFGEDDVDCNAREDDEICAELRLAARELKEQYTTNEYRKKRLLNVVDNQLQYEQYRHVLDNLDIQVEQCYLKRFRTQKSKKRKTPASSKSALSEHAVHAMTKRRAWVNALEGIFKDKNLVMPTESIFEDDGSIKQDNRVNQ
ncbi:Transcriptional regulator [Mucor circinelloides]